MANKELNKALGFSAKAVLDLCKLLAACRRAIAR